MAGRTRSAMPTVSCLRSQSCYDNRDRVTRTASDLHRQTVDRAQRRFEQQLASSERQLKSAMKQRRDQSSSPAEKRQATQNLEHLRSTLNNNYTQLVQEKVDEVERYMNQRHDEEHQPEKSIADRKLQEAIRESELQSERTRRESINQIIRERDAICEEKLAAQKSQYQRLLEEQARRLRAEQASGMSTSIEHLDMAEVKGRLARIEYEHMELKKLIFDLRSDLLAVITQQPTYRSVVNIPNFVVQS